MVTSRSRNSYMRVLRSVTLQPIGMSSRSLKVAIDLRDLVIDRLLAGDQREVGGRVVELLAVVDRFADAHVDHDLVERGTCIGFL